MRKSQFKLFLGTRIPPRLGYRFARWLRLPNGWACALILLAPGCASWSDLQYRYRGTDEIREQGDLTLYHLPHRFVSSQFVNQVDSGSRCNALESPSCHESAATLRHSLHLIENEGSLELTLRVNHVSGSNESKSAVLSRRKDTLEDGIFSKPIDINVFACVFRRCEYAIPGRCE